MKLAILGSVVLLLSNNSLATAQHSLDSPTPLSRLLAEAEGNNPQISAAEHASRAAAQGIAQASALPDTKLTVQQLSVGSPKPFAGYTNSDFAYIGFGASQELPFPGKLKLRGQAAARQADAVAAQVGVTQANVVDAVKADYIHLAYLQQTLALLEQSKASFHELVQDATLHYEVGQGMQQDVLQAQIEHTKLVREVAMHHEQVAQTEAHLKGLLHRDQSSADIVTEPLQQTTITTTITELLNNVRKLNPEVQADAAMIRQQDAKLASAKQEGKPDFDLSYMYQNTDPKYRDYYMWTVDMRLPRKKRVNAEIGEASENLAQSRDVLDAELQQQLAAVKEQYVRAASDSEVLTDDRDGLIPQTEAEYRATMSAYGANREQFAHVVSSFLSLLNLRLETLQTLEDHEAALARLETLTGATLR